MRGRIRWLPHSFDVAEDRLVRTHALPSRTRSRSTRVDYPHAACRGSHRGSNFSPPQIVLRENWKAATSSLTDVREGYQCPDCCRSFPLAHTDFVSMNALSTLYCQGRQRPSDGRLIAHFSFDILLQLAG